MNARTMVASRPIIRFAALSVAALSVAALSLIWLVSPVLGTQPQVTICHATALNSHPYDEITVDVSSIDSNGHGGHIGPVWPASGWGDIIPPFDEDDVLTGLPSLNWDAAGQAIFENECKVADQVEQSQNEEQSQGEEQSQNEEAAEDEEGSENQGVLAGAGTAGQSRADTALAGLGSNPLPTIAFSLILLASLSTLAYANVKSVRNRS